MRKTANAPRRLYIDASSETMYVRFNARLYAAPASSTAQLTDQVVCVPKGQSRITVLTPAGRQETWKSFKV